eukprot:SAG25_NODE_2086_length_1970_cov_2.027258_3_plen_163_part_01
MRASLGPGGTGLLTVQQIIRGGCADGQLQPGDILLRVDGELCGSFVQLEAALDEAAAAAKGEGGGGGEVAAVAPLLAAVGTQIYLCGICSLSRNAETQRPRPGGVQLQVVRGGVELAVGPLPVHDLHALTPSRLLCAQLLEDIVWKANEGRWKCCAPDGQAGP